MRAWRWAAGLAVLCAAPLIAMGLGFDFSTLRSPLVVGDTGALSAAGLRETAHHALRGSFTHTLLEWTALGTALAVAVLALVHYRLIHEPSLAVIGIAMACAAAMDGFHTLAADRLIDAAADNRSLVPFTWALCRWFHAVILLIGVSVFVFSNRPIGARRAQALVACTSIAFVLVSYGIIHACAASRTLPQTMFPDAFIKRPYDVYPLMPYLACGLVVFPRYLRQHRSVFAYTHLLALIPHVATQLYMAFGSVALHDSCFNIAHGLKIVAYAVPLAGLLVEHAGHFRRQQEAEDVLREYAKQIEDSNQEMENHERELKSQQQELLSMYDASVRYADELASAKTDAESATTALQERAAELEASRRAALNLMSDMDAAKRQADAANLSKSEFLANMSHEIRTPMTAILGFGDVLLDPTVSDAERVSAVQTIRRNGEHLLEIINGILDLSKIEAGKLEIERTRVSPRRIAEEVQSLMQVRADAKGLAVNTEFVGPIPETIETDAMRLRQILINLVGNAIKFTETGGVRLLVRCVTDAAEPVMQFDVVDTGIGMTPAEAERLFEPFTQADTSTARRFGGTGLGLTISKRLAQMLGGDIRVKKSRPGTGTHFCVTVAAGSLTGVPMIEHATSSSAAPVGPGTPEAPAAAALLHSHILLAEDGPDNQRLLSFLLKRAGADVAIAENGRIAVDRALAARDIGRPFDVILMDMQMPELDGYEATSLLRCEGYDGPIIALTAHAMTTDRDKCLRAGCDDFATKPIDRNKLIAIIHAAIAAARTHT